MMIYENMLREYLFIEDFINISKIICIYNEIIIDLRVLNHEDYES